MNSLARILSYIARMLGTLFGREFGVEEVVRGQRSLESLTLEPRGWEQVALRLGWIPLSAQRAPACVRQVQSEWLRQPDDR